MKKLFTLFALVPGLAGAQSLVYSTPENRTALLEEFTGIHCGYCPEGHAISAGLEAVLKDRYVAINIHAGGYAVPGNGEPDFRTDDGTAIDAAMAVSGYPAGTVNRRALNGALSYGRGSWEGVVYDVLDLPSPVNVGVESAFDDNTRELTVHVVGYYTGTTASGNDRLSVALKEDHIIGYQADYTNGTHQDYDHMAVLRDHITETWGEDIGNPVVGETVERTYTYTVPVEWDITNCKVVAFIGEYQQDVYQAREVAAVGGTTLVIGNLTSDIQPYRPGQSASNTDFSGGFTNQIGADEQYTFSLTSDGAPLTWTSGILIDGAEVGNPATITIADGASVTVEARVTPDAAPGIGHYTLTIASVTNNAAPAVETAYHVISGVHDLIVTNPQAEPHEMLYQQGLFAEPAKASTTRADFTAFGLADALVDVNNLYLNISWTFPSYTDEVANVLADFMDAGGNLMIAGQDIGWDQSGATGAYGTPVTQAFYTDYLLADFVDDGSTADNQANFETGDAVFGTVGNTSIVNVFGGANQYPDRFEPIAPAVPILRYNDPAKIGGLRAETGNHKVVYFGIGPEQVGDQNIAHLMVQLSHDWFYGIVSVEEFDAAMGRLGQVYPSPATDVLNIPVDGVQGASTIEVMDALGQLVLSTPVANKAGLMTVDVSGLSNGVYSVRARGVNGPGAARMFEVLR